jgi:hypothetical protein
MLPLLRTDFILFSQRILINNHMADILKFPDKFFNGKRLYRIPLYTDMDVDIVVFCVNAFGETDKRITVDDLIKMDPVDVIKCIDFSLDSGYISSDAKYHLTCIRKSIEELPTKLEN